MNNNKTPGQDGIPVDFYKVFWKDIKTTFHQMMIENFQAEILHPTARQGILNLIPKASKDTRYIKNLRPITLLNTDYKIIEKAVANKMLPALKHIINKDQRGFMKDRRISVNIRKMLDIIHLAEQEDLEAVVLSLDFVKCFDKCSFSILHGSLKYFKFGQIVQKWTEILYRDYTVKVQNNGYFSQQLNIHKGVHQGGCCSSVYFLVIAEILALSLRRNEDIDGLTIREIRNLLNQFADDMDIFTFCNKKSLDAIFLELENFRKQSGFTLSYEKTTLYRIGSLRHSSAEMYNISQVQWTNQDINVLGVTIAHEDVLDKNYKGIIEKTRQTLHAWYNRGLSLVGKIQVINTLVASLFVYKMMVLPRIPKQTVKTVENMLREFIWNGKKAKISLQILQNQKKDGGLQLVNLTNKDKALKATWPFILNGEEEYAKLVYSIIHCGNFGDNIWRCSLEPKDVKHLRIRNTFWEHVLESWCEFNYFYHTRIENQCIWYNSKIRINNKPFLWLDGYQAGLLYVHQLFQNCRFKTEGMILEEFGISTLRYNSLKSALPREWKQYFLNTQKQCYLPLPPSNYDMFLARKTENISAKIYKYMGEDVMLIHNKYLKWIQDLGTDFCQGLVDFGQKHLDIFRVTNVAKYRSFQYRLLQRGIVTNIQLCAWKITNTKLCTFCKQEDETLVHLFIKCTHVQTLWDQIRKYIQEKFPYLQVEINPSNIILNQICPNKRHGANFICLLSKQYIYRQRCFKESLSFPVLQAQFRRMENVEKYIAVKNNKLQKHLKKWNAGSNSIDNFSEFVTNYVAAL